MSGCSIHSVLLWSGLIFSSFAAIFLLFLLIIGVGDINLYIQGDDSISVAPDQLLNVGYIFFAVSFASCVLGVVSIQNKLQNWFVAHLVLSFLICAFVFSFGIFCSLSFRGSINDAKLDDWKSAYNEYFVKLSISDTNGWALLQDKLSCCGTNAESVFSSEEFGEDEDDFVSNLLSGEECDSILSLVDNEADIEQIFEANGVVFCETELDRLLDDLSPWIMAVAVLTMLFSLFYTVAGVSLIIDDYFEDESNLLFGVNKEQLKRLSRQNTENTNTRGKPLKKIQSLPPSLQGFESDDTEVGKHEARRRQTMRETFEAHEREASRRSLKQVEEAAERNKPKKIKLKTPTVQGRLEVLHPEKPAMPPRKVKAAETLRAADDYKPKLPPLPKEKTRNGSDAETKLSAGSLPDDEADFTATPLPVKISDKSIAHMKFEDIMNDSLPRKKRKDGKERKKQSTDKRASFF